MKEIETAVGYDKVKKNNRRELRDEIRRRAELGKPVPWQELYVVAPKYKARKAKGKAKASKKDPPVKKNNPVHIYQNYHC